MRSSLHRRRPGRGGPAGSARQDSQEFAGV